MGPVSRNYVQVNAQTGSQPCHNSSGVQCWPCPHHSLHDGDDDDEEDEQEQEEQEEEDDDDGDVMMMTTTTMMTTTNFGYSA